MTGMDKLEFRGMKHPARNNEIWIVLVESLPYGVFTLPLGGLGLTQTLLIIRQSIHGTETYFSIYYTDFEVNPSTLNNIMSL